jgi:mannose-6-phosphate isomerase-like protein (cupin superfamily)
MSDKTSGKGVPIFLRPDEGRHYAMGRISAVFKADGSETRNKYSISEWWLDPKTKGPGAHSHDDEDCVFYVIEGTMTILLGDRWIEAPRGSFVVAPSSVTHDFENRSTSRAGLLNFSIPGGFEENMPAIAQWYRQNPPKDTDA